MKSTNNLDLNVNATIKANVEIDEKQTKSELEKLFDTIQQKLKETTTREIGEYATAAGKAISDSWDSAKQTVTDTGGEAISDTLSAIFSGEMDKVQNIWDTAWTKMGDGLEKTWEGLLSTLGEKAMDGLGDILQESILDPISNYLDGLILKPLKDWGSGVLKDVLDWIGIGDVIGNIFSDKGSGNGGDAVSAVGTAAGMAYEAATGESLLSTVGSAIGADKAWAALKAYMGAESTATTAGDVLTAEILANGKNLQLLAEADVVSAVETALGGSDTITAQLLGNGPAFQAAAEAEAMAAFTEALGAGDVITAEILSNGPVLQAAAEADAIAAFEAAMSGGEAAGAASSIGFGMATAGLLAAAELFAMAMGEPGPTAIFAGAIMDAFGMADKNYMSPEDARQAVSYQSETLATQAGAAAAGEWSAAAYNEYDPTNLAFTATARHGAGNSIASVGGITTEEIEAQVAAMGPYAQALYDVQTIAWQVSDALSAYNESAEMGLFAVKDQADQFRDLALELGLTEVQYRLMIEAGYSYEQISAVVTETAGDLRVAMIDVAGAMERAAAETGLAGEQADIFGSQAAALWEQVQAGTMGVDEFDQMLEDLGRSLGLDASASEELAGRLENMLAATSQAGEGAQGLSNELAALAAESGAAASQAAIASDKFFDLGDIVGGAGEAAEGFGGLLAQAGAEAVEFGQATSEVMSSTFVSWADGFGGMADAASDLSGEVLDVGRSLENVFGSGGFAGASNIMGDLAFTYHDGGMAGAAGWPRFHSGLLPDELPAVLQRGEAIIQRSAVNSETLPVLKRINDTGRAPASGGGLNVHVEVHGNVLGDGDGMEELARIIDRRLRRIDAARYSM